MRRIKIKQQDAFDCGAVCLTSVAAFYKQYTSIAKVRQYSGTDLKGANILGIVEAAKKMGFLAKGVKGTWESLFEVAKPAIVHVKIKQIFLHFMVLYKTTKKHIYVMDPEIGKIHAYTHQQFKEIWTGVLVLLAPNTDFKTGNFKTSKYQYIWNLLKPQRSVIIQILIGALIYTMLGLCTSIYIQKITDYVLPNANNGLLNLLSTIAIIIILIQTAISLTRNLITIKLGQLIDVKLILSYHKHLIKLPQSFFDNMRVGEIISRINDAVKIRNFINEVSVNIFLNVCIVTFSILIMFTYSWKLTLLILLLIPIYILLYLISNQLNKKQQRVLMERSADLESQLVESISAIATIKKFGLEEYTNLKTENRFIALLKSLYKNSVQNLYINIGSDFSTKVFTIILFWVGCRYVLQSQLTAGELFSFYALLAYFVGPLSNLITNNKQVQEALIASDRLFEIMELEREDSDQAKNITLTNDMLGDITFQNVQFRYGTRAKIFEDISFTIPNGKITAIIGDSGSGKSTIINLLQNIYELDGGEILINKYNTKYITNQSLRSIIGVIPQKVDLFAGNVTENIAVGDFEPDMKKIIDLCQQLGILQFIEKLPNNFNTYLGENGASLSGGQKQRIAIARALYKDPSIIIMDEATSSLDVQSEYYVQNIIKQLCDQGKTIIMVTHKLKSITIADNIILLKNGKVEAQGIHQHLLNANPYYQQMWQYVY